MKINWEVKINEKKVSSKDTDFSFDFDIEFSFNSWHLVAKEINYKNEKEQQLINKNFKSFTSEFKNLYLNETLGNTKFSDWFKDQDDDFQRNWLGSTRFELYKKSDFPIDKFVVRLLQLQNAVK